MTTLLMTESISKEQERLEKITAFLNELTGTVERLKDLRNTVLLDIEKNTDLTLEENNALSREIELKLAETGPISFDPPAIIRSSGTKATVADVQKIFPDDFISVKDFNDRYGTAISDVSINFTRRELEHFANRGMHLVPEVAEISGKPTNLAWMVSSIKDKKTKTDTPLLWGDQFDVKKGIIKGAWFENDSMVTNLHLGNSYRLRTKDLVASTTSKTVAGQAGILCTFVESLYRGIVMPEAYKKAIDEFRKDYDKLIALEQSDWQEASRQLVKYKALEFFMENSVSSLNALLLHEMKTGERLLDGKRTRNNTISSDLNVLDSGVFDSRGMSVGRWWPNDADSVIGSVCSCTGIL